MVGCNELVRCGLMCQGLPRPRETAINLEHQNGCLKHHTTPIYPCQGFTLFLPTVLLTLNQIAYCTPIGQKCIQEWFLRVAKLLSLELKDSLPTGCHAEAKGLMTMVLPEFAVEAQEGYEQMIGPCLEGLAYPQ
jgi:hypothetical protein